MTDAELKAMTARSIENASGLALFAVITCGGANEALVTLIGAAIALAGRSPQPLEMLAVLAATVRAAQIVAAQNIAGNAPTAPAAPGGMPS